MTRCTYADEKVNAAINERLEGVRAQMAAIRARATRRIEEMEQRAAVGEDRRVAVLRERIEALQEVVAQAEARLQSMRARLRGAVIEEA